MKRIPPLQKKSMVPCIIDNLLLLGWVALVHLSLGYAIKPIYVVVLFFVMRLMVSVSPLLFRLILSVLTIVGTAYMPVGHIYGAPDINVVGSLIYTDSAEAYEFISGITLGSWIMMITLCLFGTVLLLRPTELRLHTRKYQVFTTMFCVAASVWSPIHKGGPVRLPEIRFINDAWKAYHIVVETNGVWAKISGQTPQWTPQILPGQRETYVLVIGESVRRDYVHAFGNVDRFPGGYSNTPWLDTAPATLYTQYHSTAASTVSSLTNTLVVNTGRIQLINHSIVTLAQAAGFETWWLSNQGQKGQYDSPVALIGGRADHVTFLKSGSSDDRSSVPDTSLLPLLDKALDKPSQRPKLIVLHLMGSHPRACIRTQDKFDVDMGSEEISCYVKSIAQTDDLLRYVADALNQHGGTWSMMYFADHGLSYVEKGEHNAYLTHSDKTKENYEVPFFILNSDDTQQRKDTVLRSAFNYLPLFAKWIRVDDPLLPDTIDATKDVLDFKGNKRSMDTLPSIP